MSAGKTHETIEANIKRCRGCKRRKYKEGEPEYCWRHNKKQPVKIIGDCDCYEPIEEE